MILSVELHNFLTHKHTIVYFHENNNIFVGDTDSGKSAFIKGIKWCRWNRPLGDDFYSWPEVRDDKDKSMWVKITTDNHVITRKKGKEEEYILDGISFKAFGTNVPEEIEKAFNISTINWQNQLDSHFLLSSSSGDVATYLNSVANLSQIDKGTNNVNSAIRELTADIKYKEAQDVKLTEDLKAFDYLPQFEKEVEELEELEKKSKELDASFTKLYQWTASYYEVKDRIEYFQKTLSFEKPVNDILKLIDERAEKDAEVVKLHRIVSQLRIVQNKIAEQSKLISLETPVLELLSLMEERKMLVDAHEKIITMFNNFKTIELRIIKGNNYIKDLNETWEKEFPSICPLCGKPK